MLIFEAGLERLRIRTRQTIFGSHRFKFDFNLLIFVQIAQLERDLLKGFRGEEDDRQDEVASAW